MTEMIVAAAIIHEGHAWWMPAPARHHDVIWLLTELFPEDDTNDRGYHGEQGFITSEGRFVGRKVANHIAYRAGQTFVRSYRLGADLFSEDLW